MRLFSFFSHWRRILAGLAVVCVLGVIGFAGWFIWAINSNEDREGEIPFRNDHSLVLHKTGPGGISYTVNNALATFRLDVAKPDKNCERIFPSYAAALKFAKDGGLPTTASVQMIHGKCKQFDDDLCATLEQAVQSGAGHLPGKLPALQRLAQKLIEARNAAPEQARPAVEEALLHVATAIELGGGSVTLDPTLAAKVDARKAEFLGKPVQAAPNGFWTENEKLRQIFLQDRYLMQGISLENETGVCMVMARVISDDPELALAFDLFREFDAKLTNPPIHAGQDVALESPGRALSFRDIAGVLPQGVLLTDLLAPAQVQQTHAKLEAVFGKDAGFALINYARSPEYSLLFEAARDGNTAGRNASLEMIIDAIQRGKLSLKPVPNSGWYDYQWYALETLLLPERAEEAPKLTLTAAYKKRLEEAFKSSIAKNRETHIKQLPEIMMGTMSGDEPTPTVEIHPEFSAEPTATVYLRTARAYRFLHTALNGVLGDDTLKSLRRATPGNPDGLNLGDELNRMALLCYGIHHIVSVELGLQPAYLPGEISAAELDEAKQTAAQWLAGAAADPDLARDTRMAAPIAAYPGGAVDYWATCGIRLQRVKYEYKWEPAVGPGVMPVYVPGYYYLPTDITLEFQKPGILTRAEFQRMCDSCMDEASLRRLLDAPDRTGAREIWRDVCTVALLLLAGIALFFAWKARRVFSRRVVLSTLAVVALLFAAWVAVMFFDQGYRTRFFVRQIASRNSFLAMVYRDRYRYPFWKNKLIPPATLRVLVDLLRDADPQVRYVAVNYLDTIRLELSGIENAEENLREAAGDSDPLIAAPALSLLGFFKDDRNVEFLRATLKDVTNNEAVRAGAVYGLGRTGDPRGIDDVVACARQTNAGLRDAAVYMLGSYDDPRCINLIAELVQSPDVIVSSRALSALDRFKYLHPGRDVSNTMDPALLSAACITTFTPGHRRGLAMDIHNNPTRLLAYENMLLVPGSQDAKSMAETQGYAAWGLADMKSAASDAIPAMQKVIEDPQTAPDARKKIEETIKYIQR
ncbi:MAG: HEAT repeat domain-containing protein [Chthoniobacteraceae bacterium]